MPEADATGGYHQAGVRGSSATGAAAYPVAARVRLQPLSSGGCQAERRCRYREGCAMVIQETPVRFPFPPTAPIDPPAQFRQLRESAPVVQVLLPTGDKA